MFSEDELPSKMNKTSLLDVNLKLNSNISYSGESRVATLSENIYCIAPYDGRNAAVMWLIYEGCTGRSA